MTAAKPILRDYLTALQTFCHDVEDQPPPGPWTLVGYKAITHVLHGAQEYLAAEWPYPNVCVGMTPNGFDVAHGNKLTMVATVYDERVPLLEANIAVTLFPVKLTSLVPGFDFECECHNLHELVYHLGIWLDHRHLQTLSTLIQRNAGIY